MHIANPPWLLPFSKWLIQLFWYNLWQAGLDKKIKYGRIKDHPVFDILPVHVWCLSVRAWWFVCPCLMVCLSVLDDRLSKCLMFFARCFIRPCLMFYPSMLDVFVCPCLMFCLSVLDVLSVCVWHLSYPTMLDHFVLSKIWY